jgi:hypothetical protein
MNYPKISATSNYLLLGLGTNPVSTNLIYKAIISSDKERYTTGSIVRLSGRGSTTAPNTDPLFYYWSFVTVPIGSQVQRFGFHPKDDQAQFSPDKTGIYRIQLIVGDTVANSPPAYLDVEVSIIVDSTGQQINPDVTYMWSLLGDFYTALD